MTSSIKSKFSLSPLAKSFSAIFISIVCADYSLAADQCGASGGTVSSDETVNCTISSANSTLDINAKENGWLKFVGGNATLNINNDGYYLYDNKASFGPDDNPGDDPAAITVLSPTGKWVLNNNGNMVVNSQDNADLIWGDGPGDYVINNSGTMEVVNANMSGTFGGNPTGDKHGNIFDARMNSQDDGDTLTVNNSGEISTSGTDFLMEYGNNNNISVTNNASGVITSTDYDVIETYGISGSGNIDVQLVNDGTINSGRSVIYQDSAAGDSTTNIVNNGIINSNGVNDTKTIATFQLAVDGVVNLDNSGAITSKNRNQFLWVNGSSGVTVHNYSNSTTTVDGSYIWAENSDSLSFKNDKGASVISSSSNLDSNSFFISSDGFADIYNDGLLASGNTAYMIQSHAGANIVNDTDGVIQSSGSGALIKQTGTAGLDVTNKGELIETGSAVGILNTNGTFMLQNSGSISTQSGRAIQVTNSDAAPVIENTGVITSENAVATIDSVGNNTIINGGVISNAGGTAILTSDGDDTLTLLPGSDITGVVDLGGGVNTLILDGDSSTTGTFDIGEVAPDKQYRGLNHNALYKENSSTWILTGDISSEQQWSNVDVKNGTLEFSDTTTGTMKADSFSIESGANADLGSTASLDVTNTMTIDGQLDVNVSQRG